MTKEAEKYKIVKIILNRSIHADNGPLMRKRYLIRISSNLQYMPGIV